MTFYSSQSKRNTNSLWCSPWRNPGPAILPRTGQSPDPDPLRRTSDSRIGGGGAADVLPSLRYLTKWKMKWSWITAYKAWLCTQKRVINLVYETKSNARTGIRRRQLARSGHKNWNLYPPPPPPHEGKKICNVSVTDLIYGYLKPSGLPATACPYDSSGVGHQKFRSCFTVINSDKSIELHDTERVTSFTFIHRNRALLPALKWQISLHLMKASCITRTWWFFDARCKKRGKCGWIRGFLSLSPPGPLLPPPTSPPALSTGNI